MHADAVNLNRDVAASLQYAIDGGFLTNTTVAAADTNAGLQAAVTAAVTHADAQGAVKRINRACDYGNYDGSLVDANILSLTTTAGLLALTQESAPPRRFLVDG